MLPAVRVAAQLHRSHSSDALLAEHYGRVVIGRQAQKMGARISRSDDRVAFPVCPGYGNSWTVLRRIVQWYCIAVS